MQLPNDETLNSIERLARGIEEMHEIIFDPSITSIRIVVNPEKMVIAEARRSFTYLNFFGFNTDAIVINSILVVY
jgi:arsenite-transporting ATPase